MIPTDRQYVLTEAAYATAALAAALDRDAKRIDTADEALITNLTHDAIEAFEERFGGLPSTPETARAYRVLANLSGRPDPGQVPLSRLQTGAYIDAIYYLLALVTTQTVERSVA